MRSAQIRQQVLQLLRKSNALTSIARELNVPRYYVQIVGIYAGLMTHICERCELPYMSKGKHSRYCSDCRKEGVTIASIKKGVGKKDPTPEEIEERAAEIRKGWGKKLG